MRWLCRRATVNTFGYIAKAIGPQDVLVTLLNNLKVQERQNRVCTTVAIAIVAETCAPFTVLPALMNEYKVCVVRLVPCAVMPHAAWCQLCAVCMADRAVVCHQACRVLTPTSFACMQVPELKVQNGVLKSLSFLFEYIGEMGKDYIYAVTPLLEDALMDRDLVHRQTAASVIQHMALGVAGAWWHLWHALRWSGIHLDFIIPQAPVSGWPFGEAVFTACVLLRRPGVRRCADAPAEPGVAQHL